MSAGAASGDAQPHAIATLTMGSTFAGRYEVGRCIAAGGMGAVYEVIHRPTRKRRALKVMLPALVADPDLRSRFHAEATVTGDIESQHITEVFDAGIDEVTGSPYLVMELLRGQDLGSRLEERGPLGFEETVELLAQVALALERTHAAGVVHRDLKPENVFLTRRDDGAPHVKVLDFGIAKVVAQHGRTLATTRSVGSPLYMSPEQIRGDADIGPAADLWALGHIAYAMLVGEAYFERDARGQAAVYPVLVKVMAGTREPASQRAAVVGGPALPVAFDLWFARATAANPAERFDSALLLVEALADALGVAVPAACEATAPTKVGPRGSAPARTSHEPTAPLPAGLADLRPETVPGLGPRPVERSSAAPVEPAAPGSAEQPEFESEGRFGSAASHASTVGVSTDAPPRQRRRGLWLIAAMAMAVLAAAAVVVVRSSTGSSSAGPPSTHAIGDGAQSTAGEGQATVVASDSNGSTQEPSTPVPPEPASSAPAPSASGSTATARSTLPSATARGPLGPRSTSAAPSTSPPAPAPAKPLATDHDPTEER